MAMRSPKVARRVRQSWVGSAWHDKKGAGGPGVVDTDGEDDNALSWSRGARRVLGAHGVFQAVQGLGWARVGRGRLNPREAFRFENWSENEFKI